MNNAWPQLIAIATQGQGADISHVGSTWVSSLMTIELRTPRPTHLISKIGGEQAFVHSTWTNVTSEEDRNVYGIPLSAYVYIVAYRKDLLAKAGLNSGTAFATPHALEESVKKLEASKLSETSGSCRSCPIHSMILSISPHPGSGVRVVTSWIIAASRSCSIRRPRWRV